MGSAFESLQLIKFDKKAIAHRDFVLIDIIVAGRSLLLALFCHSPKTFAISEF
ncbi:MAG: hypothetical protein HWQ43_32450 [Nostoc sp. JL31]|uniref:hypothetical protein n=1 Tax=Nostoc sp. JL31 TaxID=2815395 RepID=UPI0025D93BBF|nr:hypothetical protein [Nostoc sp. JL31]MBN3893626.1 hypothetical protein [Nostoc sp. JL31]